MSQGQEECQQLGANLPVIKSFPRPLVFTYMIPALTVTMTVLGFNAKNQRTSVAAAVSYSEFE